LLKLTYKRFGFLNITEAWFVNNQYDKVSGRIVRIFDSGYLPPYFYSIRTSIKSTLILNLKLYETQFTRKRRYEIRKIAECEPIYQIIGFEKLRIQQQNVIAKKYNAFAKSKGIQRFNKNRVRYYPTNFKVSMCCVRGVKNYNIYIYDTNHIRLLYSWSTRKPNSHFKWSLNRFHTYKDINKFKNDGFEVFDFGGFNSERMNGIDKFKKAFGGVETTLYKGILVKSVN
jgi:hypothetical protein